MNLEARLSRAVVLALSLPAAQLCACAGASAPPPAPVAAEPEAQSSTSTSASTSAQVVAVAPADAGAAALPVAATPDARALCTAYRDAHQEPQPGKEKPVEVQSRGYPDAVAGAVASDGQVRCRIAWSRTRALTPVKRRIAPVCCQSRGRRTACPPASLEALPTTRVMVEEVTLSAAGSMIRSEAHVEHEFEEPARNHCGRRSEAAHLTPASDGECGVSIALRAMAELEAISVAAFERLARELTSFGAPAALVTRARSAAVDERRHARMMGLLARDAGAPPQPEGAVPLRARTLFEVALENAVEGCVYETYGAATALFQAQRAAYPHLRAVFASIAPDETAHAALAWDLDAWFASQLAEPDVAQLRAAKVRAAQRLADRLAEAEPAPGLGLPNRAEAETLRQATFADLLAA